MTPTEIDFLNEKDKVLKKPKRKLGIFGKSGIYLLIIFGLILISMSIDVISSGENLSKTLGNISLWDQIKHLIGSSDKGLSGENEDRINILLLGMGGENHEGPYLSDTMMLASFKPSTKQVALISIPRDLSAPIPGYGWWKINHANSFGETKNPGQGGLLSSEVVGEIFDLPIHYYVRIDFAGFEKIIDDLGGVNVEVENTLDDPFYPVAGKESATTTERYEHLYIEAGRKYMNGDLALKFVRSRQARGIEGSDFARSKRQQKIILAAKEKGLSFETLANPYRISNVMDTLSEHLATNLEVWEIIRLFNLTKDIKEENIFHRVLDDSPDGPLYSAITEEGAFVLLPKAGNFSELQFIAKNIFEPKDSPKIRPKRLEIQNGTKISGLAVQTAQYLESFGYQVIRTKNAPTQDYQKPVVYNLTQNQNDQTAANIAKILKAEFSLAVPNWAKSTTTPEVSSRAEVLIILGEDRKE